MNIATLKPQSTKTQSDYTQLAIQHEEEYGLAWYYMHGQPRPCFTSELVHEIQHWFDSLVHLKNNAGEQPEYVVMASRIPGVYNLGGDLNLFCELIQQQDREGLMHYASVCNDILFRNHIGHDLDITTISLVQGDALGGGFEAAISSHVVIAERNAKMGLPDILFNLFPGAGAYSMLSRKIGAMQAERLILSGRLYNAEEMHEMGVVDILVEEGLGRQAVYDYIKKENHAKNGYRAFRRAKRYCNPITRDELLNAASVWVDAAFRLKAKDLRMMERLVKRQSAKMK